jgi:hypothetical protein
LLRLVLDSIDKVPLVIGFVWALGSRHFAYPFTCRLFGFNSFDSFLFRIHNFQFSLNSLSSNIGLARPTISPRHFGANLERYLVEKRSVNAWVALLEDAARKRREACTEPGAWAVTVIWATEVDVRKMVTQECSEKTQKKLDWIHRAAKGERGCDVSTECPQGSIPHKTLESIRFFLVYVARRYMTLVPYLKGIHLTLDSWRVNRGDDGWPIDDDGWRLTNTIDNRLEDSVARQGGL